MSNIYILVENVPTPMISTILHHLTRTRPAQRYSHTQFANAVYPVRAPALSIRLTAMSRGRHRGLSVNMCHGGESRIGAVGREGRLRKYQCWIGGWKREKGKEKKAKGHEKRTKTGSKSNEIRRSMPVLSGLYAWLVSFAQALRGFAARLLSL